VITDAAGIPLAVILSGGHRNDVTQLLPLLDAIPPVRGLRGRPRRRPGKVYADRGYDHDTYASRCGSGASPRSSPAAAPGTAPAWAGGAGSWNAPSPGSMASDGSAPATNAAPTPTRP
jgi:hypothetical protein